MKITEMGPPPYTFVFLHGLFGRGRNWTSIARYLQPHSSLMVDLPNHGESPWTDHFSYEQMATEVSSLLDSLENPVCLVGHSMGGRVAMLTALTHPDKVERLVIEDTAPEDTSTDDLQWHADAMAELPLKTLVSRHEAQQILNQKIRDSRITGFLLQSLGKDAHQRFRWTLNIDLLRQSISEVGHWVENSGTYTGPVLWITGIESDRSGTPEAMKTYFPFARQLRVKNAGHWVHADQPEVFIEALRHFLGSP